MRIFITFGDEKFAKARDFSARMAKILGGFDKVITYSPLDIDDDFKKKHIDIFSFQRGYGLWLWKPYFIYKTLMTICQDGDSLFYGDAGSFFIRSIDYIEKSMGNEDIWVSHIPLKEWQFTKVDVFKIMDCQDDKYMNTKQIQAGFLYLKKTDQTVSFIKEWLSLCCDVRLLHPNNIYSMEGNPKGFYANREDQSILSLLCKKKYIQSHQDPTQFGKYPEKYYRVGFDIINIRKESEYPVSILLHRTGDLKIGRILRQLILIFVPRIIGVRLISKPILD